MEQLVARRAHNPKVAGSSPVPATNLRLTTYAGVAQSAERILGKDKVTGSIPVTSSTTWRHSSVGQSNRFIPDVSAVQIRVPPPIFTLR